MKHLKLLLQLSTAAVFFGRAYQYLYWDAPFRTLLWDERIMSGIVESFFSLSWEEYINSLAVDDSINQMINGFGWFYVICGIITLGMKWMPRMIQRLILLGGVGLIFLALLLWKEKFYSVGQFFEYSLQFSLPFFFYFSYDQLTQGEEVGTKFIFWLKLATAVTFVCHGLYAVGYYPQPVTFMEMTVEITGWSDNIASRFLKLMGFLDFVVAALIFLPKTARPALIYMVVWGFLTALARIWTNFDFGNIAEHLHQTGFAFLYRAGHFLAPLGLWWVEKRGKERKKPNAGSHQNPRVL